MTKTVFPMEIIELSLLLPLINAISLKLSAEKILINKLKKTCSHI